MKILLLCREGFEKECAEELRDMDPGAKCTMHPGFVFAEVELSHEQVNLTNFIFARQVVPFVEKLPTLDPEDRAQPIAEKCLEVFQKNKIYPLYQELFLEYPDTNAGKKLLPFAKKLKLPLTNRLKQLGVKQIFAKKDKYPRLHIFFADYEEVYIGISYPHLSSAYPLGIRHLRLSTKAPSRASLKLEEAFLSLLDEKEREHFLVPQMRAVDLGAAPGGWSYHLLQKGIKVYAIDNAQMHPSLMQDSMLIHVKEDAFSYKPLKSADWLFCDVVDSPLKISQLMQKWLVKGWAKHAVFNLKLPMKKRYGEVKALLSQISDTLLSQSSHWHIRTKHLYHDREEITVLILKK